MKKIIFASLLLLGSVSYAQGSLNWSETINQVAPSIVSIQFDIPLAFDSEQRNSSQATGFIVDADRGIILSNRHVVNPGPIDAKAIFINREEVSLKAIYIDPIHDFGFFQYDPDDLEFISPLSLNLSLEGLQVGTEIRVIGNDAGEQLSILSGTIARLDREAPNYGRGNYNDFNTYYIQAATNTSGGSSGSPVINIYGDVVALNAGASAQAASSFFLPLPAINNALENIQQGSIIQRGGLLTEFSQSSFADLRREGFPLELERQYRDTDQTMNGLLVVNSTLVDSLQVGDVLLTLNDYLVKDYLDLEILLNRNVDAEVNLRVFRDGEISNITSVVFDLHSTIPDQLIKLSGGVLHETSYQMQRHYGELIQGIYIANTGYIFDSAAIPNQSVIVSINGEETPTLESFLNVFSRLPERERVNIGYRHLSQPNAVQQRLITKITAWHDFQLCEKQPSYEWTCNDYSTNRDEKVFAPFDMNFATYSDETLNRLQRSLVMVNFDLPIGVFGINERHYYGTGVIIGSDTDKFYVAVDQNTVPTSLGDIRVTIGGTLEIPARPEFIHPYHNLAIISFEREHIGSTAVEAITLNTEILEPGEEVNLVGLRFDHQIEAQTARVAQIESMNFGSGRTLRLREMNLDVIDLDNAPNNLDGVILDLSGSVRALWSSFPMGTGNNFRQVNRGIPSRFIEQSLISFQNLEPLYSLDIELEKVSYALARNYGLSDDRINEFLSSYSNDRQLLMVKSIATKDEVISEDQFFRNGDIVISLGGQLVNSFNLFEELSQRDEIEVVVLRNGNEITFNASPAAYYGDDFQHAISWNGLILQNISRALRFSIESPYEGVMVSFTSFGSPGARSSIFPGVRIIAIENQQINSLNDFIGALESQGEKQSLRITLLDQNDRRFNTTIQSESVYWPSTQYTYDPESNQWIIG